MNMTEFASIQVGDAVKVKVGTMSGYVEGWRIVRAKNTSFLEIRAQGTNEFIVRPGEIQGHVKGGDPIPYNPITQMRSAAKDLFEALEFITRCPKFNGPAGTTLYAIKDDAMAAAKAAIRKAGGENVALTRAILADGERRREKEMAGLVQDLDALPKNSDPLGIMKGGE